MKRRYRTSSSSSQDFSFRDIITEVFLQWCYLLEEWCLQVGWLWICDWRIIVCSVFILSAFQSHLCTKYVNVLIYLNIIQTYLECNYDLTAESIEYVQLADRYLSGILVNYIHYYTEWKLLYAEDIYHSLCSCCNW